MAGQQKYCSGCRNDFYNHGGKGCWRINDAKVVTRYRIHWWTAPTVPGAFTKVQTNSCHDAKKYDYYDKLPACAVAAFSDGDRRGK